MRTAVAVGLPVHVLFWGFDWLVARHVYPGQGDVLPFLWLRLSFLPFGIWLLHRLFKHPPPSARLLAWFDALVFGSAAATLGVIGAKLGGIAGPYTPGVFLVLICRGAFRTQHWRHAILPVVLVLVSHFAALLWEGHADPRAWAQLSSSAGLTLLALHLASLIGGAALITTASHRAWILRNRVFEARQFGPYRLEAPLGEGAHGEVWRAMDTTGERRVAIKVLKGERVFGQAALTRFHREARALSWLKSPHTVRVLDSGVSEDGLCYLVMELLEGETLSQLVERSGPLPRERALRLVEQAACALAEAHAVGLVHRDVKPDNLFVVAVDSPSECIKLLDFGVARMLESRGTQLTRTGAVVGTPAFMAPEVLRGNRADQRADVYGLGASLLFLLTGRPPSFDASWRTPCTGPLADFVSCCLAPLPRDRFDDAAQLLVGLKAVRELVASESDSRESIA